jgi:hypothetical protein
LSNCSRKSGCQHSSNYAIRCALHAVRGWHTQLKIQLKRGNG